jgi:hypothetical protein
VIGGRRRRWILAIAAALLVASAQLTAGYVRSRPRAAPLPDEEFSVAPEQLADPATVPMTGGAGGDRLVIPSLGIAAPLELAGVSDGRLELPEDVDRTVLWRGSAPIGARGGSLVVAGHLDDAEQEHGALYQLSTVRPGAAIQVVLRHTVTSWKVTGLSAVPKASLPAELWRRRHGPRRLYLVTCGGPIVSGHYSDNVVVTAVPVTPD